MSAERELGSASTFQCLIPVVRHPAFSDGL